MPECRVPERHVPYCVTAECLKAYTITLLLYCQSAVPYARCLSAVCLSAECQRALRQGAVCQSAMCLYALLPHCLVASMP